MAFFRETVGTVRTYLLLAGTLGTILNLVNIVATDLPIVERLLIVPSLALTLVLLYLGFTLPSKLRSSLSFVLNVFRAAIGLNVFYLALDTIDAITGRGIFSPIPILGILLAWYLLRNARRLGTEMKAEAG